MSLTGTIETVEIVETPEPGPQPRTRAEINRENARKSTGPKTEAGKAASSANARTHGAYARPTLYDTEKIEERFAYYVSQMGADNPDQLYWLHIMAECEYKLAGLERTIQGLFLKHYAGHPNQAADPRSDDAFLEDFETSEAVADKRERYERLAKEFIRRREAASKRYYQIRRELNSPQHARRYPSAEPDARPCGPVLPPPPFFSFRVDENEARIGDKYPERIPTYDPVQGE